MSFSRCKLAHIPVLAKCFCFFWGFFQLVFVTSFQEVLMPTVQTLGSENIVRVLYVPSGIRVDVFSQ